MGKDRKLSSSAIKLFVKNSIKNNDRFKQHLSASGIIKEKKGKLVNGTKSMEMFLNRLLSLQLPVQQEILAIIASIIQRLSKLNVVIENGIQGIISAIVE